MTASDTQRLMDIWAEAMAGDFAALRPACVEDCRIWHSSDDKWMPHRTALDAFITARDLGHIPEFRDVRLLPTAGGFLCQATMAIEPVGLLHILQLVTIADGRITLVEEYIAPEMNLAAQLAA